MSDRNEFPPLPLVWTAVALEGWRDACVAIAIEGERPAIVWPFPQEEKFPQCACPSCGTRYDLTPVFEELKRRARADFESIRDATDSVGQEP